MVVEPDAEVSSSMLNSPAAGGGKPLPSGVATTFALLPFAKSVYCPPGTDAICLLPSKSVPRRRVRPLDELGRRRTRFASFVDAFLFQFYSVVLRCCGSDQ